MSSFSDPVLRGGEGAAVSTLSPSPDLRSGTWTRLGQSSVLGDEVTENYLTGLAEQARAAARAQGYAVGWAQGRREAHDKAIAEAHALLVQNRRDAERREAEHQTAIQGLLLAAQQLQDAAAEVCAQLADDATELALSVTHEVLGREVAIAADPGADVVRRVLAVLPLGAAVRVRLHPGALGSEAVAGLAERGVEVVPDHELASGEALVETDEAVIDLRISTALERLTEVLR